MLRVMLYAKKQMQSKIKKPPTVCYFSEKSIIKRHRLAEKAQKSYFCKSNP